MANTVQAAARLYGAGLVGIAPMDEAYVDLKQQHKQAAVASAREGEYRAAAIAWIVVGVLTAGSVLVWLVRR